MTKSDLENCQKKRKTLKKEFDLFNLHHGYNKQINGL